DVEPQFLEMAEPDDDIDRIAARRCYVTPRSERRIGRGAVGHQLEFGVSKLDPADFKAGESMQVIRKGTSSACRHLAVRRSFFSHGIDSEQSLGSLKTQRRSTRPRIEH